MSGSEDGNLYMWNLMEGDEYAEKIDVTAHGNKTTKERSLNRRHQLHLMFSLRKMELLRLQLEPPTKLRCTQS